MLRRTRAMARFNRAFPVMVMLAILIFGIGLALSIERTGNASRQRELARTANLISARIDDQIAVLRGVSALFRARPDISREEVQRYLATVRPDMRAPGMLGVGFAMAQRADDHAGAQAAIVANYDMRASVWPPTRQSIVTPIVLLEPMTDLNRRALGFDMYGEANRRDAMDRAWTSGEAAATAMVQLVQSGVEPQPGFLVYVPLYGRAGTGIVHEGRAPLIGFIYAPYRVDDLLDRINALQGYSFRLSMPGEVGGAATYVVAQRGEAPFDARRFDVMVADQRWRLELKSDEHNPLIRASVLTLIASVLLALLLGGLLWVQARRLDAVERLSDERAARTRDKDLMLREMSHRMKNVLARVQAIARASARSAGSLDNFVHDFSGRLQAMGNALRLLSATDGQSADFRALIAAELDSVNAGGSQQVELAGPDLLLDERQSQALSLAIHELVTNSVKYGALAQEGRLRIAWRVEDGRAIVDWVETGLATPPDLERSGFGTRFLRTLLAQQLRGGIERRTNAQCYCVDIWFPVAPPQLADRPVR